MSKYIDLDKIGSVIREFFQTSAARVPAEISPTEYHKVLDYWHNMENEEVSSDLENIDKAEAEYVVRFLREHGYLPKADDFDQYFSDNWYEVLQANKVGFQSTARRQMIAEAIAGLQLDFVEAPNKILSDTQVQHADPTETYTVQHGDTLQAIVKHHYGKGLNDAQMQLAVKALEEVNGIQNSGMVHPGQILQLPPLIFELMEVVKGPNKSMSDPVPRLPGGMN